MEKYIWKFKYMNHRGEVRERSIAPDCIEFLDPGLVYQPGWFISGICQDKKARRSFALSRIIFDGKAPYWPKFWIENAQ